MDPIQVSAASGHGIGKSVLVAWLILFIMCTRPFCKITVTAMTETQLRTKTWAELGKWFNRSLVRDIFTYNTGRGSMMLYHPEKKVNGLLKQSLVVRKILKLLLDNTRQTLRLLISLMKLVEYLIRFGRFGLEDLLMGSL